MKKIYQLEKAVAEAKRFIEKAEAAIDKLHELEGRKYSCSSSKEVAAAKRASMDLTRELVNVRKSSGEYGDR